MTITPTIMLAALFLTATGLLMIVNRKTPQSVNCKQPKFVDMKDARRGSDGRIYRLVCFRRKQYPPPGFQWTDIFVVPADPRPGPRARCSPPFFVTEREDGGFDLASSGMHQELIMAPNILSQLGDTI